jgi:hypothetical protein
MTNKVNAVKTYKNRVNRFDQPFANAGTKNGSNARQLRLSGFWGPTQTTNGLFPKSRQQELHRDALVSNPHTDIHR